MAATLRAQAVTVAGISKTGAPAPRGMGTFVGLRGIAPPQLAVRPARVQVARGKQICMSVSGPGTSLSPGLSPELQESLKREVAKKGAEMVKSGMIVGLGTGSTSAIFIEELGQVVKSGKVKDITVVATSYQAKVIARQVGLTSLTLNDVNRVDLAFDGADEVDASKNLMKGGGAAHTLEKVVDKMATKCVILVDQSKVVNELGSTFPVVVEVLQPAIAPVLRSLVQLGGQPEIRSSLRKDGPVITDLGNMVVDVRFPQGIKNPAQLEKEINNIPGVVENGLFTGFVDTILVAVKDGENIEVVDLQEAIKKYGLAA